MGWPEAAFRMGAGVALLLLNAFFVAAEFGLTRLRQLPEERAREGRALRTAWEMTERLEIYLTACQLGITSTSILLGVVAEPAVTALLGPAWTAVGLEGSGAAGASVVTSVVIINLVHMVWGEQAPTYLGVERPLAVAARTARPLRWWTTAVYPFIHLGDRVAKLTLRLFGVEMERSWTRAVEEPAPGGAGPDRGELRRAMGEVLARGGVSRDRRREVIKALDIDDVPVREIMVPLERIVALEAGAAPRRNRERLSRGHHTRYPLVGDSLDDFRGIVYLPGLLDRAGERFDEALADLEEVAAPPLEVDAATPVSEVVDLLQEKGQELALVRSAGEVVGLVTTTDAFEAIIGDLRDPFDREE